MTTLAERDGQAPSDLRGRIDRHVGGRLRRRRTLLGISQEQLGARVGLTFQQVQKYERGVNRIGAGRLYALSQLLGVPIGYFFEGAVTRRNAGAPNEAVAAPSEADSARLRETADLVRAFVHIKDPSMRACIVALCRAMARPQDGAGPDGTGPDGTGPDGTGRRATRY